jgi:hypothetical protein
MFMSGMGCSSYSAQRRDEKSGFKLEREYIISQSVFHVSILVKARTCLTYCLAKVLGTVDFQNFCHHSFRAMCLHKLMPFIVSKNCSSSIKVLSKLDVNSCHSLCSSAERASASSSERAAACDIVIVHIYTTALCAQHAICGRNRLESRAAAETTAERTDLRILVATHACAFDVKKLANRAAEQLCVGAQKHHYLGSMCERTCSVLCGTHSNADAFETGEELGNKSGIQHKLLEHAAL